MTYQPEPIEEGIYKIPLQLDEPLESQRLLLESTLIAAQKRLRAFAAAHGWKAHTQKPFATGAHVYAAKESFDHDLLKLCDMDTTVELPRTYCAALEKGILMCVSPVLYREIYPEGDEENAFEKLIAHEMAHRLHIRILSGDEEAMGPVWFYEGFALFAASQFEHTYPLVPMEVLWQVIGDPERGSYRQYAGIIRYFASQVSLQELVENAGKGDFIEWLKERCS